MTPRAKLKLLWIQRASDGSRGTQSGLQAITSFIDWKSLGAAYSLATLWTVISWKELLFSDTGDYLAFEPRRINEHLAIFAVEIALASLLYFLSRSSTRSQSEWQSRAFQTLFIFCGALAFGPLSFELFKWLFPEIQHFTTYPLVLLVSGVCVLAALTSRNWSLNYIAGNIRKTALLFLPFGLLIGAKSASVLLFDDGARFLPQSINNTSKLVQKGPPGKKIVWVIFDEFDFAARRVAPLNDTPLPDIERLRSESFVGRNAYSPYNETLVSIPALLTGKRLSKAKPVSADDLLLYPEDGSDPFSFRDSSTIFSELEADGLRTAIVGWYHPYSRVFKDKVSYCVWRPRIVQRCTAPSQLFRCSVGIVTKSLSATPIVNRLLPATWQDIDSEYIAEEVDPQAERMEFLSEQSANLIADPRFNLLFFHFSVPHAPYVVRKGSHEDPSYFTSMESANDLLARLREILEKAGQWDQTVMIVSSDHPWRSKRLEIGQLKFLDEPRREDVVEDHRVPFIIRFPGQRERFAYDRQINTVNTKSIILNILANRIKGPSDLAAWLDSVDNSGPVRSE